MRVRGGHRARGPRAASHAHQGLLRVPDGLRRAAEHAGLSGVPGPSRGAAGPQRRGRAPGRADRAGPLVRHPGPQPLRAKELLLPGPAQGLPDQPVRRAVQRARAPRHRGRRQAQRTSASRASTWRRTPARTCTATRDVSRRRPEPLGRRRSWRSSASPTCAAPPRRPSTCATLRDVLVFIGVNDGNLEEGSFRCDANVSIRPAGETKLGTRVELKNINSFRFVEKRHRPRDRAGKPRCSTAAAASSRRRAAGTRTTGRTFSLRSKEEAQDYRYFPDPDLPPLVLDDAFVAEVEAPMPELPRDKRERFVARAGARALRRAGADRAPAGRGVLRGGGDAARPRRPRSRTSSRARCCATSRPTASRRDIPVSARQVAELLRLVDAGHHQRQAGQGGLREDRRRRTGRRADVVAELGMQQVSDAGRDRGASASRWSSANPKQAEQLRAGKASLMGFFVGQVMKETQGSREPAARQRRAEEAPRSRVKAQGPSSERLPASPAGHVSGAPARARVLIIDDNVELVGSLHAVLMSAELSDGRAASNTIEVVTASRGDEGLAEARAHGFDVAIVDVKLPDTSGVLLIPKLREACPFGEVVLITGFATMDAAIGALRSGAYAFVPKSFRPEELISTVEQALTKVRLARERDELERRYRALVELTDVLVVGLDAEDRVALFNRRAASFAGIEPGEAAGRPFVAELDSRRGREPDARGNRAGPLRADPGGRDGLRPGLHRRRSGPGLLERAARGPGAAQGSLAPVDGAGRGRRDVAGLRFRHRRYRATGAREAGSRRRGPLGDGHPRAEPRPRDPKPPQRGDPAAAPARQARRQAVDRRRDSAEPSVRRRRSSETRSGG